jgi:hypothetical protein
MTSPIQGAAGIVVKCRTHPLGVLLHLLSKTTITVDADASRVSWGEHFFPCEPGSHEVKVSFRYLTEQLGSASIRVEVHPGQTIRLNYQSPPMFFLFLAARNGAIEVAEDQIPT